MTTDSLSFFIIIFLSSLIAGIGSIVLLLRCWRFKSGIDSADGIRKTQEQPVLRIGGLSLLVSFLIGYLFVNSSLLSAGSPSLGWPFLILAAAIFLLGFVDDLYGVPASIKLFAQIGIGVSAYLAGMRIEIISNPMGGSAFELGGFSLIFTVFWFVALPNLINLIDGMDGLAGGVGLFLSLTLATIGHLTGNPPLLILSLAMAGGLSAFLIFNLPPAKIYMGDGGAYLVGYFIAATSLITSNKGSVFGALLVVVIALGFPILDTLLAMLRRGLSGLPLMQADARHLHHRLMTLGFSKRTVLMLLYGVFASLSLLGLSVFISAGYTFPIVGMIITVGLLFSLRKLGLPHTLKEAKQQFNELIAVRKDVRYAYSIAQVLEHDLERVESSSAYWDEVLAGLAKFQFSPAISSSGSEISCHGGQCLIHFEISGDRIWRLCCQPPPGGTRSLDRILRCFVPAILNGAERWGSLPANLGILPADECAEVLQLNETKAAPNLPDEIRLVSTQS
ncbi:MAG: MraY family glycosyltransferase [Verrucomicrobiales bacterium]|nr:MraY family glycosyltransferase [Verrucomicrobiales bacterium]